MQGRANLLNFLSYYLRIVYITGVWVLDFSCYTDTVTPKCNLEIWTETFTKRPRSLLEHWPPAPTIYYVICPWFMLILLFVLIQ